MKLISIQEAYTRKFERQKRVPALQLHAAGHCAHIGPISPGCRSCFEHDPYRRNFVCGARCNVACGYCSERLAKEPDKELLLLTKANIHRDSYNPDFAPSAISFSGGGEPLMYLDVIEGYMRVFRDVAPRMKAAPWFYLYTNGLLANREVLLRLKELGFDEIRFHIGASDFSKEVFRNMEEAMRHLKIVTVETPAWPLHRRKLFESLSTFNDIGIKHLNLGEIEIKKHNMDRIASLLPDAEIYQCHEMHLDDGGLTYDIMEEVIAKNYSYSVLDCNSFVKSSQRGKAKRVCHESTEGLFASYT